MSRLPLYPNLASQVVLVVKNLPANAGDTGLIPGLEEGVAPHSSILAGKIPWTEEPGGLWPGGVTKSWTLKQLSTSTLWISTPDNN